MPTGDRRDEGCGVNVEQPILERMAGSARDEGRRSVQAWPERSRGHMASRRGDRRDEGEGRSWRKEHAIREGWRGRGLAGAGGAPPVDGQRLCGLLMTLSRMASNRQTAARETVESAQH